LLLYYPPLFRVSAEPGIFHTQAYQNPVSAVLEPPSGGAAGGVVPPMTGLVETRKQFDLLQSGQQQSDDKEKKDAT
jgi:hypothetical protein